MTEIAARVGDYLAIRRALGHKLVTEGRRLEEFAGFVAARGQDSVTIDAAVAWAATAATPGQVATRLSMVRRFATYLAAFDPAAQIPPQRMLAGGVVRRPPHVFSRTEIAELMAAAAASAPALHAVTFSTLIGLMAATGLRTGEAVRLDRGDVDLDAGLLLIRYSKYGKSRRIPLHPTTLTALADYTRRRDQLCPRPGVPAFLLVGKGERLSDTTTGPTFRRLLAQVGITVPPGRRRPRLHDLRHTFAVTVPQGFAI
ncbi:MAG: tyrosine-type recombinase/integrase [Mycobacterium leprae]